MFLGHHYRKYESKIFLTQAINSLHLAIREAGRVDNEVIFQKLILFLRKKIYKSRFKGSISSYKDLVILPTRLYPFLNQKYRNSLIGLLDISFRESATGTSFIIRSDENIDFDKQLLLVEINYWGCIQLMKVIIEAKDYSNFTRIFDEINQITSSYHMTNYKSEKQKDSIQKALFIHRSFYFILFSWLIFLYDSGKIDATELSKFDIDNNILNEFNFYRNIEFFELFRELKNRAFNHFLEIDDWEIVEHKPGKAYMALSSRQWLNLGLAFLLLKDGRFSTLRDLQDDLEIDNNSYSFLQNEIKEIIDRIEPDLSNKWGNVLYPNLSIGDFQERFDRHKVNIFHTLSELKKMGELNYFKLISEQPLSEEKIREFSEKVGENWERNSLIPSILKEYDCVEYRDNIKELDFYGYFQINNKMKSMFTEEGNKFVYGVSDIGSRLASDVETQFYSKLKQAKPLVEVHDLKRELNQLIEDYEEKNNLLIFVNWRGIQLINTENDLEYLNEPSDKFISSKYKSVPIVKQVSLPQDTLLLIDLTQSINYILYQDKKWFNNELLIEVLELSEEVIKDEMDKYDTKWRNNEGYELTMDEALLVIKSSILIKVLFKYELEIINTDSYHFLKF